MKNVVIASFLLVSACAWQPETGPAETVELNFDFASTSLGFRNSGAFSVGRLYLWDQDENTLVPLASDIRLAHGTPSAPRTLRASSVSGISVAAKGKVSEELALNLSAAVSKQVNFLAENASRTAARNAMSAMSAAYLDLKQSGVDVYRAWRVEDAVTNSSRYKYVLLTDFVTATKESIAISNSVGGSAGISVTDEAQAEVTAKIPHDVSAECTGPAAVCYFDAAVYEVFLNESRNLDYTPMAFNKAALSRAFRN